MFLEQFGLENLKHVATHDHIHLPRLFLGQGLNLKANASAQ